MRERVILDLAWSESVNIGKSTETEGRLPLHVLAFAAALGLLPPCGAENCISAMMHFHHHYHVGSAEKDARVPERIYGKKVQW